MIVVPNDDTRRAVLDLAVPAAVRELLAEEPLDERRHVDAEVRAGRDDVAVDARLDLALEEAVVRPWGLERGIPPDDALADEADGPPGLLALGIESEPPQELEHMEGVGPVLGPGLAGPQAIRRLEREQLGAPALGRDLGALGGDDLGGLVGQVAHHLPADRGVRIEQPVHDRHGVPPLTRADLSS